MTEREKGMSEIRKHSYNPPPENLEEIKPKITPPPPKIKKHFPVEKLEAWLREEKQGYIIRDCDNIQGDLRYKALENFCQQVLDKIAELEGSDEGHLNPKEVEGGD